MCAGRPCPQGLYGPQGIQLYRTVFQDCNDNELLPFLCPCHFIALQGCLSRRLAVRAPQELSPALRVNWQKDSGIDSRNLNGYN